jgi:tripartite-type tricarboxylate transporter receptor subunit TctC
MKSWNARAAAAAMVLAGGLAAHVGDAAAQSNYPTRPIRFIAPFAPGGTTTLLARLVGDQLTKAWGQPVIVDNRPGGNTIIGTELLARAQPDGHTLILTTTSHAIVPQLQKVPFDPIKDFAPIATIANNETLMLIHPSVPASTLKELIALAKSRPGKLNYAALGTGGIQHLASEMFKLAAGVDIQAIPYKGAGPAITALIGGQVHMSIQGTAPSLPHIKSGKLKALAITGDTRWAAAPQVPTFAEAGLPAYDQKYWQAILAPAGTPAPIVDKLSSEIGRMLTSSDLRERLIAQGMNPWVNDSAQLAGILKSEMAKFGKIIKAAHIKTDL